MDMELHQLDVKTAFLHGDLEEIIYMTQPEGYELPETKDKVCLLKKSLYGLKQSPRQWYLKFDEHMLSIGFERSMYDSCVYFKRKNGVPVVYLLLYVDDMLVASKDLFEVEQLKADLKSKFEMKDLGNTKRILGMDIVRSREKGQLWLSQHVYIQRVLEKFRMHEAEEVSVPLAQHFKLSDKHRPKTDRDVKEISQVPYANVVGSIMYTMICTRPDLAHSISVVSRFMANPGKHHWEALKWILRYLKSSSSVGILYENKDDFEGEALAGFVDSDYAANLDTRKSQSGYIFYLYGATISWKSCLQSVVALSTTEAEYIAITEAVKEGEWLRGILGEFGIDQNYVTIHYDS